MLSVVCVDPQECCCTFLTVSIAVVDSTEPPGGRQVLCSHGHVNRVAQVKLHSHTQATLHKHKVPKPVNTYTFIKKIILKCKFKEQSKELSRYFKKKRNHFGRELLRWEPGGRSQLNSYDELTPNPNQTSSLKPEKIENIKQSQVYYFLVCLNNAALLSEFSSPCCTALPRHTGL